MRSVPGHWYVGWLSGYCTVVIAANEGRAKQHAGDSKVPGDYITTVREATVDDIDWFVDVCGGEIR